MMVKQTRLLATASDVVAVRLECRGCGNALLLDVPNNRDLPDDCPLCKAPRWLVGTGAYEVVKAMRDMADADPKCGATVYLEIDADPPPP